MGFRYKIAPAGLENVLGYLGRLSNPSEGPAFEPLMRSPSALRRLSNPSEGPAFEPLISNEPEARVLWGGCRTLPRSQPSNP
jgi:hypothetical protein